MASQKYRSKAVECLESASRVHDAGAKNALVELALHWLRLADLHETNHRVEEATNKIATRSRAERLPS
jgi:hypothetical protein